MGKLKYDCLKCIGYCCAIYERVEVNDRDIKRLAKHFGVSFDQAKRRYTKDYDADERILKRTPDPIFGESCIFQNPETRLCSIYDARPGTCKSWPSHGQKDRCVYYDALEFERQQQGTDDYVPIVQIQLLTGKEGED